jgi:hypothetical protein
MNRHLPSVCALILSLAAVASSALAHGGAVQVAVPPDLAVSGPLPALLPGVTELRFTDMFKMPIGPKGLEATATLIGLHDKAVRLVGYMASTEMPVPGRVILTPLPVSLGDEDESLSDDLPAATVFVHLSGAASSAVVPNLRGLIHLQGRLSIGAVDEPTGHVSAIRLMLDEPTSTRLAESTGAKRVSTPVAGAATH